MLKFLVLIPDINITSPPSFISYYCQGLKENNIDFYIKTILRNNRKIRFNRSLNNFLPLSYYSPIPLRAMKFSFFNWLEKQILYFSLIYKNGFNKNIVVHTHFSTHALNLLFSELIIERTNSKTIFTEHYNMIEQIGDHFVKPFYTERTLKNLIAKFSGRTAVSEFAKKLCERYFNSKFTVIPNCLPDSYFGVTLPKNDLKISFFGGLVFLKGLKELLEVGKKLKPLINNFQLNIFGSNDEQFFFNDFIEKTNFRKTLNTTERKIIMK